ncbi:hypothetical protein SYYSPA8_25445 [Streptomyces yaizuensis]|uniref:Uncharacterized protein n=1 Tax=Streptomyces yaizuensis TaxID=2989713 RepID=A0ABQ5P537_9ACTN|nr:hypothetical protein SYYSPA8_25445 [Streptomyces sp. YSPA8]
MGGPDRRAGVRCDGTSRDGVTAGADGLRASCGWGTRDAAGVPPFPLAARAAGRSAAPLVPTVQPVTAVRTASAAADPRTPAAVRPGIPA